MWGDLPSFPYSLICTSFDLNSKRRWVLPGEGYKGLSHFTVVNSLLPIGGGGTKNAVEEGQRMWGLT